MSTYDGYQVLLSMLYSNEEMVLEGWLGSTPTGQWWAGGGKETGLRALGERSSPATLGGQLPSTPPYL